MRKIFGAVALAAAVAVPAYAQSRDAARRGNPAGVRDAYKADQALLEVQRLSGQFDVLAGNQDILDKRISNLEKERGADANLQAQIDDLRRAQESLREAVSALGREQQRQRQEIVDEISRKVEALYKANPPAPPAPRPAPAGPSAQPRPPRQMPTEGYDHTVAPGQTLSMIAREYNCCTVQDIMDANPKADPNRLKVGQTLFIPDMSTLDPKKPKNRKPAPKR